MMTNRLSPPFFYPPFPLLYIYSNNHPKWSLLFLLLMQFPSLQLILSLLFWHTYPLQQYPLYCPNCLHRHLAFSFPCHDLFHCDDLMDEPHLLLSFLAFFKGRIYKHLFWALTWLLFIKSQRTWFLEKIRINGGKKLMKFNLFFLLGVLAFFLFSCFCFSFFCYSSSLLVSGNMNDKNMERFQR